MLDIIDYIINGGNREKGGLKGAWYNATTQKIRDDIERVMGFFSYYTYEGYDFDFNNIKEAVLLNASKATNGAGHNAILLLDGNGCGFYFSYGPDKSIPLDSGEMHMDILLSNAVERFFKNGDLDLIPTSTGELADGRYDRRIHIPVTPEEGKKMFDKGLDIFLEAGIYSLIGHQCDNIASKITEAGNKGYFVKITPNLSFEGVSKDWNLEIKYMALKQV